MPASKRKSISKKTPSKVRKIEEDEDVKGLVEEPVEESKVESNGGKEEEMPKKKAATPRRKASEPRVSDADKRIDWTQLSLIGTEADHLEAIKALPYTFNLLNEDLSTGHLSTIKHSIYLWCTTEPFSKTETSDNVTAIIVETYPVIFVLVCPHLSENALSLVSITTVQKSAEEIIHLSNLRLSWAPYINQKSSKKVFGDVKESNIKVLTSQSRRKVASMGEEEKSRYSQILPWIVIPHKFAKIDIEAEKKDEKNVSFTYKPHQPSTPGQIIDISWDKDVNRTKTDFEIICDDDKLDYEVEQPFLLKALKGAYEKKREQIQSEYDFRKKFLAGLSESDKKRLDNDLKVYKYYPEHPDRDMEGPGIQVPDVNRYYKFAHEVFPKAPLHLEINGLPLVNTPASAIKTNSNGFTATKFTAPAAAPATGTGFFFNPTADTSSVKILERNASPFVTGGPSESTGFSLPVGGFGTLPAATSTSSTGGFFFVPPAASAPSADSWTCLSCEAVNPANKLECNDCMSAKPKPK